MEADQVLAWIDSHASESERAKLARYGIPAQNARGIPMREMKALAATIGTSHELAQALWSSGGYEARTIAAFVDDPAVVSCAQMDEWAYDFDNWAICDTVCFALFDRAACAWDRMSAWMDQEPEFVRRAAFALLWALSAHDKSASDATFLNALEQLEAARPDDRPLVNKAVDMALRAVGKRSRVLNEAAIAVATRMSESAEKPRAWIGRHALTELASEKLQARLRP